MVQIIICATYFKKVFKHSNYYLIPLIVSINYFIITHPNVSFMKKKLTKRNIFE